MVRLDLGQACPDLVALLLSVSLVLVLETAACVGNRSWDGGCEFVVVGEQAGLAGSDAATAMERHVPGHRGWGAPLRRRLVSAEASDTSQTYL
jgi:hypothetical protein